jgi:hypothetical protein
MSVEKLQKEVTRWEGRLSELQRKGEQEMGRANTLETERRSLALAAAEGDEKAEKAMNCKAAEADEARRQSDNFALMARQAESKLEALRDELAEAKWQERLTALRQLCERRAAITTKVERAVSQLIGVLREVQSSSDEIVNLARQFDDRFTSGDARRYFTTSLGYFLWALQCELRESTTQDWRFQPRDPKAGVQDALVKYDQWCMEGLLTVAGHGIEAARQVRRRARGSIQVQAGERLYRAKHRIVGVRGLDLQPGEVIALRPEEVATLGEAVEPADEAAQQVA